MTLPLPFSLRDYIKNVSYRPGVYQMLDSDGTILYIGKAKNLKNRLTSYLNPSNTRIAHLVSKIAQMTLTICATEEEALELERRLIQEHRPFYNILLKEVQHSLFITISKDPLPRIQIERLPKRHGQTSLGPFPSYEMAKKIYDVIIKTFKIRTCSNATFQARNRPCLEYQIGHCTAPCFFKDGLAIEQYQLQSEQAIHFLKTGISQQIQLLQEKMIKASEKEDFETAALVRDQIKKIRYFERQKISSSSDHGQSLDVFVYDHHKKAHHLIIVEEEIIHSRSLHLSNPLELPWKEVLSDIWIQIYPEWNKEWVPETVLTTDLETTTISVHGKKVCLRLARTEQEKKWLEIALQSLVHNTQTPKGHSLDHYDAGFKQIETIFLQDNWKKIACIDIAHHQGAHPVGAIVYFSRRGPEPTRYRKYLLSDKPQNNDPLSIQQTLLKHKKTLLDADLRPDLLVIDGGKSQLQSAFECLQSLSLDSLNILAMSKDRTRKNGLETYWILSDNQDFKEVDLSQAPQGLLVLQELRDAAHRAAGRFHYQCAKKALLQHGLSGLKGIGEKKKKELLMLFGGWDGLQKASLTQLQAIPGIGEKMAQKIYNYCHPESGVC